MIAYLLRHGRAVDVGPYGARNDEDRWLTAAGAAALETSLRGVARLMTRPAYIAHSGYVRARQSAEILAAVLRYEGVLDPVEGLMPGRDPRPLLALLDEKRSEGLAACALVGHEPTLGELLGLLLSPGGAPMPLQVGMLAALELDASAPPTGRVLFVG